MSATLTPEDVEYLREGYRLFREHDPAFMDRFAPDATFVYPTTLPAGGIYAVRAWPRVMPAEASGTGLL